MPVTTLRRKKDKMYSIAASGDDYYAFWSDGRAGLYIDGTFASYRATGGPAIPDAPSLIHTDSQAIVGDGSIVTRLDDTSLEVWDVSTETTYSYAVPAGYVCSPAIYSAGYLWWIEREAVQHGGVGAHKTYFRLRKSRTDLLTDLATVQTYEAVHQFGFSVVWDPLLGLAMTAAAAIVQCRWWDDVNGEVNDLLQVRLELDGVGATDNGWPAIGTGTYVSTWEYVTAIAPPTSAGIAAANFAGANFLYGLADDAEASPIAFWSGAEWELGGSVHSSVSADGTEGSVYDNTDLVRGPAATGTPTNRFTVGVGPGADVPNYMFIKG